MGDEGVGVHVIRHLESRRTPDNVELLDGGTGGLHLLEPLQAANSTIMIDATADGAPPGTVRRLRPRFSKDYPRTLTAHDIGLKDLLDAMYLLGNPPPTDVTLFAVSIDLPVDVGTDLTPEIEAVLPKVADMVVAEITGPKSRF
jgi:hydrogenase maturation protease